MTARAGRTIHIAVLGLLGLSAGTLPNCTPVGAWQPHPTGNDDDQDAAQQRDGSVSETGATVGQSEVVDTDAPCTDEGRIACAAEGKVERVVCKSGAWVEHEPCKATELCTVGDAGNSECTALATECMGHELGKAFCDGPIRRICHSLEASEELACGANQGCRTIDEVAACSCVPAARERDGKCEIAGDCVDAGCDELTECLEDPSSGAFACSPCPPNFAGSGETGCSPLLANLELSCGSLTRPLSPGVYEYDVEASLFCQSITFRLDVPAGTEVTINGEPLGVDGTWTSGILDLGDNPFQFVLGAKESGLSSSYSVRVGRVGRQEGYVRVLDANPLDRLGASVAIDNDVIVAGAPYDDNGTEGGTATDSGAAFVFVRKGGQWVQQARLKPNIARTEEYFGSSVAIVGDLIVVGAPGNDPTAQPMSARSSGAVYLFEQAGQQWTQVARIEADNGVTGDMFGFQVLLTQDRLFVTAVFDSEDVAWSGALYVYERDGTTVRLLDKLKSSRPSRLAAWGSGISYDGSTIAVGAFTDSTTADSGGSVTTFGLVNGKWTEDARLEANRPESRASFGFAVAVLEDTLVVGAPRWGHWTTTPPGEVYIFRRRDGSWIQTDVKTAFYPRDQDFFGSCLILNPDMLIIGANGDSSGSTSIPADPNDNSERASGAIYVFARQGDEFVKPIFVKPQKPTALDAFGVSIGLSGETLATGAAYDALDDTGAVYVLR